jgi:ATP-binding cassette subfamily B protein
VINKKLVRNLSFKPYQRAIRLLWDASPKLLMAQVILQLIQATIPVGILYITKILFDVVIEGGSSFNEVVFWLVSLALLQLISVLTSQAISYFGSIYQQKLTDKTSALIIQKSIDIPYPYFENHLYHDSLHLAQQQSIYKLPLLHQQFQSTFSNLLSLVLLLGYFFSLVSLYAWIIFLIALPLAAVKWYSGYALHKLEKKTVPLEREANYFHYVLTGESYAKEIRSLNYGAALLKRFKKLRDLIYQKKKGLQKKLLGYLLITEGAEVGVLSYVLIAVARQAYNGTLAISLLIVYIQGIQRMQTNLKAFLSSLVNLIQQRIFLNDLFLFLDIKISNANQGAIESEFPDKDFSIDMKNLTFYYEGNERPALKQINMHLEKGKIIGLVGANGSGKSSLVKLLAGLYEVSQGEILLGGKPINLISKKSYRENTLFLFQEFQRYFLTLEDLVSLGKVVKDSKEEKIWDALKKAQIADYLSEFPEGLQTKLGLIFKGGKELSGGQWQKLAIARAFYREPSIIVLDEPTSSMDALAENEIFTNLKGISENKVILIITHRLYNLKDADFIYVMDKGEIVQEGRFDDLVESEGIFKKLHQQQSF